MEISRGTINDIEEITGFQIAMALESEGTILDGNKVRSGVKAAMEDESKGTYIVARTDGKPIASLMITREWSDWNNGWYWWIQSVYVMPEYRGQGKSSRWQRSNLSLKSDYTWTGTTQMHKRSIRNWEWKNAIISCTKLL